MLDCGQDRLYGTNADEWVKKAELDNGRRAGVPTDFAAKLKALERENRELRQANEIHSRRPLILPGRTRPPVEVMIAFIDDHREAHGVEPICKVLPIAPSTFHGMSPGDADPASDRPRAKRDAALKAEISRSSMRTSRSMACGRSGGNCGARTLKLLALP